jgi:LmbE family N-acetylglucosaminyl deacetylase
MRHREMDAAAAALGPTVRAVQLGYEDGELVNSYEVRLRVAAQIRIHRPQLLVTFNPAYNFNHYQHGTEHKDHKTAGAIALDCFYPLARDYLQLPELWQPRKYRSVLARFPELAANRSGWDLTTPLKGWKVAEAYLFAAERLSFDPPRYETVAVDVSAALETMARSLAAHASQTGHASWKALLPGIANRTAQLGRASGMPNAEWFTRVMNML